LEGTWHLNLDLVLKLRLAVARVGEMDIAKWWNTQGQLGELGAAALRRGFPHTHRFAQARAAFALAAHRCAEVVPPACVSLWRLPEATEEEFEARWEQWLDNGNHFFTVEVWTPKRLLAHYILFVISMAERAVYIAGITTLPDEAWMLQIGRNLINGEGRGTGFEALSDY
jgi:hypothetical protein